MCLERRNISSEPVLQQDRQRPQEQGCEGCHRSERTSPVPGLFGSAGNSGGRRCEPGRPLSTPVSGAGNFGVPGLDVSFTGKFDV